MNSTLELTQDLQLFTSSQIKFFFYAMPVQVHTVFPSSGTFLGGTNVTIYGDQFVDSNAGSLGEWLVCVFSGNKMVVAKFVSATEVTCVTPAMQGDALMNTTIELSFSGGQAAISRRFQYFPSAATVQSTSPASSNMLGGVLVQVFGSGFVNTGAVTVRIGPSSAPATFVNATLLHFTVPRLFNSKCHVKKYCYDETVSKEGSANGAVLCSSSNRATHSPYANYTTGIVDSVKHCSVSVLSGFLTTCARELHCHPVVVTAIYVALPTVHQSKPNGSNSSRKILPSEMWAPHHTMEHLSLTFACFHQV